MSVEARDRVIPRWFERIETGQLLLPRFQRHEAWSHDRVRALIETVLRGLPSGAALILETGDGRQFKCRSIVGAPSPTERVTEYLLDGQQRLTALWRSFHDGYDDRTYLVHFEADEEHGGKEVPRVYGQSRWERDGRRFPLRADDPVKVHAEGYIPVRLLRPGDIGNEISAWCRRAVGDDHDAFDKLKDRVNDLRDRVKAFNLPFLSLPVGTPRDVAIDVFIQMNTSTVALSAFDIVVAQVEEHTGQSLHDLVSALKTEATSVEAYSNPADMVLSVAAMREDRPPTQASYQLLDLDRLVKEWDQIVGGIAFATAFLEEERVFDAERLPTNAVLPVLAALQDVVPDALDSHGNAKTLLRKYIWRAFVTRRYENAAATRALQDLRGLRAAITNTPNIATPIFDDKVYPLPTVEELLRAGWPKKRDILARGVLAISLRGGGWDLADSTPVSRAHLPKREYHHLFPDSLLTDDGKLDSNESYRALNCALVTWNTNRTISAKEPLQYLRERVERAALGEPDIRSRLATHAVPFKELNVGGYAAILEESDRAKKIQGDYSRFLQSRANLILEGMQKLCDGHNWTGMQA